MTRAGQKLFLLLVGAVVCAFPFAHAERAAEPDRNIVQAQIVLTVAESKRLIAKAIPQMPIVKQALKDGMVIVARGTTNSYVAEELLGRKIPHGAFVLGRTYPENNAKKLQDVERMKEVVLVNGQVREDLSLEQAVRKLKPGDVVIKGANALDYDEKLAAVIVGSSDAGTTGTILPYVGARKAHLVIPVGLEKHVAGNVVEIVRKMREPVKSLNWVPTMFLLTGDVVTELEALKLLTGVSVFQAAAGGIGGAEGSVRIVCRGPREKVEAVLRLADQIQGEPPFVE
jgi:hypothetical protein